MLVEAKIHGPRADVRRADSAVASALLRRVFSTPQNGADPSHPSLNMANLTKQGYLHVFGMARIACIFQQSG